MEVYRTKDNQVSKYIHDDGSETAIKTVSSCGNILNKITGDIEPINVDRNKFSVFASTSAGCPVGCKFCYLTTKNYPYHKLTAEQIFDNVIEALLEEVVVKPELHDKYMKLSWMGMGDAFLMEPIILRDLSKRIVDWAIKPPGIFRGLDGIDISTAMPASKPDWKHQLSLLNAELRDIDRNPTSMNRSIVRVFYSLHKVVNRDSIIPGGMLNAPISNLVELNQLNKYYGIDVILHHMFIEGVNDNEDELEQIKLLLTDVIDDVELRILRFNECKGSLYKESSKFDELVRLYAKNLPKVKYQISAGSEIKAACGQFLCLTNEKNVL